jgi:hypothetical protein
MLTTAQSSKKRPMGESNTKRKRGVNWPSKENVVAILNDSALHFHDVAGLEQQKWSASYVLSIRDPMAMTGFAKEHGGLVL